MPTQSSTTDDTAACERAPWTVCHWTAVAITFLLFSITLVLTTADVILRQALPNSVVIASMLATTLSGCSAVVLRLKDNAVTAIHAHNERLVVALRAELLQLLQPVVPIVPVDPVEPVRPTETAPSVLWQHQAPGLAFPAHRPARVSSVNGGVYRARASLPVPVEPAAPRPDLARPQAGPVDHEDEDTIGFAVRQALEAVEERRAEREPAGPSAVNGRRGGSNGDMLAGYLHDAATIYDLARKDVEERRRGDGDDTQDVSQ